MILYLVFPENKTSCSGLLGYGLKSIFQLKAQLAQLQIIIENICTFILSLTIAKREVSSANSFALNFNSPGKPLM